MTLDCKILCSKLLLPLGNFQKLLAFDMGKENLKCQGQERKTEMYGKDSGKEERAKE